ncbi:MAG: class I SAM-dependent methyltransferase [Methanosarcinaceae archaeon]
MQTEEPYWLDEAYSSAILPFDTGIMARNISLSKISTMIIYFSLNKNKCFLDFGGGYGIFTRLMRDIGFDFYLHDPHAKNLLAQGFELNNATKPIELITSFECFEHFSDPIKEIENLLEISSNILFTTELLPNPTPRPKDWWYYALEGGQHISFYRKQTLQYIAKKYSLNLNSYKHVHLLSIIKIHPIVFKLLVNLAEKHFIWKFITKKLMSKTVSDMHLIKRINNKN